MGSCESRAIADSPAAAAQRWHLAADDPRAHADFILSNSASHATEAKRPECG